MVEGRNRKQRLGRDGVYPVGDHKRVALGLPVSQSIGAVVARGLFPVVQVGVVRNLEVILTVLRSEAKLVFGGLVAQQRKKSALRIGCVVVEAADRCSQSIVRAGTGDAGIPRCGFAVVPKRELCLSGEKIPCRKHQFGVAAALETITGQHVENSVSAVAYIGGIATSLSFHLVDVLGIDLRADIDRKSTRLNS